MVTRYKQICWQAIFREIAIPHAMRVKFNHLLLDDLSKQF